MSNFIGVPFTRFVTLRDPSHSCFPTNQKKRLSNVFPPDSPRFQARLIIKKSRFQARLGPCDTLDDAKDFRSMRVARWKDQITRWWFQTFFIFTPIPGEMIQFEKNIFQLGWNHQLDNIKGEKHVQILWDFGGARWNFTHLLPPTQNQN